MLFHWSPPPMPPLLMQLLAAVLIKLIVVLPLPQRRRHRRHCPTTARQRKKRQCKQHPVHQQGDGVHVIAISQFHDNRFRTECDCAQNRKAQTHPKLTCRCDHRLGVVSVLFDRTVGALEQPPNRQRNERHSAGHRHFRTERPAKDRRALRHIAQQPR